MDRIRAGEMRLKALRVFEIVSDAVAEQWNADVEAAEAAEENDPGCVEREFASGWEYRLVEEWSRAFDDGMEAEGPPHRKSCYSIVQALIQNNTPFDEIMVSAQRLYLEQFDHCAEEVAELQPEHSEPIDLLPQEIPKDNYSCDSGHSFRGFGHTSCPICGSITKTLEQYYICASGHSLRGLRTTPCPTCGSTNTALDEGNRVLPVETRRRNLDYRSVWRSACEDFDLTWNEVVSRWRDFNSGWEYRYGKLWSQRFDERMEALGYPAECTLILHRLIENLTQTPTEIVDSWGGLGEESRGPYILESLELETGQAQGELGELVNSLIGLTRNIYFELFIVPGPDSVGIKTLAALVPTRKHRTSRESLMAFRAEREKGKEQRAKIAAQRIVEAQIRKNQADRQS